MNRWYVTPGGQMPGTPKRVVAHVQGSINHNYTPGCRNSWQGSWVTAACRFHNINALRTL